MFDYLIQRGLSLDTIKKFNVGFIDTKGNLHGISNLELELSEQFLNSFIFPIYSIYGELMGATARRIEGNPKWIHSSGLDKSSCLYGIGEALPEMVSKRFVYIVEGCLDALVMREKGVTPVISILGSSLSETQHSLLLRFVDTLVLVPDGDIAGRGMITKAQTLKTPLQIQHVLIPEGYDPDTFLLEHGKEEFLKLQARDNVDNLIGGSRGGNNGDQRRVECGTSRIN